MPRSRFHFFEDCRMLLLSKNAPAFAELLRSPFCTILPHVRQLTIVNHCKGWSRDALAFDNIKEALRLLVGLESLRLGGSSWVMHGAAPRRGFMSALGSVVELEIDCGDLGDFDHALLIICAFPSLQRLYIHQFSLSGIVQTRPQSLYSPCAPYTPPAWI